MTSIFDSRGQFGAADTFVERVGNDMTLKDANHLTAVTLSELTLARRTKTLNLDLVKSATSFRSPAATLVSRSGTNNSSTTMAAFAFDDSTEQFVVYDFYIPPDLNPDGTVNIKLQWLPASASSNSVVWKIYHAPITVGSTFDVAMSTATSTSAGNASTDVISQAVISSTVANLGWLASQHLIFHVSRDAANGSDNLSGNAHLAAVAIEFPLKNSGAGPGGQLIEVDTNGTPVSGSPFTAVNFLGSNVTVVSNNNKADITVTDASFSGDVSTTNQGYLNNSSGTNPVAIQDNDGFSIRSTDATEGVRFRTIHVTTTNSSAATELTFNGLPGSSSNGLTLANNTTHSYVAWVTARGTAGANNGKSFFIRIEFAATASAGVASIIGFPNTMLIADETFETWDVSITVISNRVQINGIGDASTTIKWTANVQETVVS